LSEERRATDIVGGLAAAREEKPNENSG